MGGAEAWGAEHSTLVVRNKRSPNPFEIANGGRKWTNGDGRGETVEKETRRIAR